MSTRLNDRPLLEFDSASEWRAWLEANHATSSGIWLAVGKKGGRATTLTYEQAVEEALCWGWIDSTVRRLDAERFRQSFTPRKPGSIWSQPNKDRAERLMAAGRMEPPGLTAIETAKANGAWDLLAEIDALLIPDDLAGALAANQAASDGFRSLGDSSKKVALYWIASAKRPETRASRIAATVEAATEGRMPG